MPLLVNIVSERLMPHVYVVNMLSELLVPHLYSVNVYLNKYAQRTVNAPCPTFLVHILNELLIPPTYFNKYVQRCLVCLFV